MNRRFLLLFLFAVGNSLLMHWQLALTIEYEYPFRPDAIWSNVFACLIDTTVFFLVGLLVTWGEGEARSAHHLCGHVAIGAV